MNNNLEEKFLGYLESNLTLEEQNSLRQALDSDAELHAKFEGFEQTHGMLNALSGRTVSVDSMFKEEVMQKVEALERFKWRAWLLVSVPILAIGLLFILSPKPQIQEAVVGLFQYIESSLGALLMLSAGIATILTACLRKFKVAASFATASLALFMLRSVTHTFFNVNDEGAGGFDGLAISYNGQRIGEYLLGTSEHRKAARLIDPGVPVGRTQHGINKLEPAYAISQRIPVGVNPASTFSFDVDTASYSIARKYLQQGALPQPDEVRVEEFINYFTYEYPESSEGVFGLTYEIAPSPFSPARHLLQIGLKTRKIALNSDKGWNLVFLIDVSGSMADNDKLPLLKRSFEYLVNEMRPVDRVAIVTYSDLASVALPSTSGQNKAEILRAIENLQASGSTNGSAGIDMAYQVAKQNEISGGVNRVILATDGDFNVGRYSLPELMQLAEDKRRSGVSLTTIGFGQGNLKDQNLEQLAAKGNGNYFYLDSIQEAKRVFSENLSSVVETLAKDVKAQIEFNPQLVNDYRQIGYANRALSQQEFANPKTDAAEVGPGQAVTLLYELTLQPSSPAQRAQHSDEFAFVTIRFKEPQGDSSKEQKFAINVTALKESWQETSQDFRFAAAVSQFAEILSSSPYTSSSNLEQVKSMAQAAIGEDASGARSEFLELLESASRLIEGTYSNPERRYSHE